MGGAGRPMSGVLADTLSYEGSLPLAWTRLPGGLPEAAVMAEYNRAAEELIHVITGYQQGPAVGDGEEEDPLLARIASLEGKINLLVDLVGELMRRGTQLPPEAAVRFNGHGVCWSEEREAPAVGDWVAIDLYLSRALPRPLRMLGEVADVESSATGREVSVALAGVGESVVDAIHKFIFRHHRRLVALARAARDGG